MDECSPEASTVALDGLTVSLSKPVLVRRSRWYCWFPSLVRLPNGHLWASMSTLADIHVSSSAITLMRSRDGGASWEEERCVVDGGYSHILLPDGSAQLQPFHLRPADGAMVAPCNRISPDGGLSYHVKGVAVTGWTRPDKPFVARPELGITGFVFNGQSVVAADGTYLATLYGTFVGDARYTLLLVESPDGQTWQIRSTIAGPDCPLEGKEGPCESAICRLADGRLMCVFRLASFVPYGQCFSEDDGRSWTEPTAMPAHSVEPSLQVLADGTVALSGGRSGIAVWFNADGTGTGWDPVDVVAHHNRCCAPGDGINPDSTLAWTPREEMLAQGLGGFSSCYTELARLDECTLLLVYDRLGLGWHAIPDGSDESNSVWAVRLAVDSA